MTLETAALRFDGAVPKGFGWDARCPICQPDGSPPGPVSGRKTPGSGPRLQIRDDRRGRWLVRCAGGCEEAAVLAARGMTGEDQEIATAPGRGLALRGFAERFAPVEMRHLVAPYLPEGKCVLLDADGGTGKTALAVAWAAALSQGLHPTTFSPLPCGPARTLYLHKGEDGDDELETVYRANGGRPGMILYAGEGLRFDPAGVRGLREAIEDGGFRLVVCDALFYFLDGVAKDTNDNMAAIRVVTMLNDVARATGASFLNIRHTTKDGIGKAASNLGMGTVAFRNSHRGQMVARWHPGADQKGIVYVSDEKGSLLNERGEPFAYRRVANAVEYVRDVPAPEGASGGPSRPRRESSGPKVGGQLEAALAMLGELLKVGDVATKAAEAEAERRGISRRTLGEARRRLAIESFQGPDGRYFLSLPYDPTQD